MFFGVAQPLPKKEFVAVYREAVLLTQLLFAPIGIAEEAATILGDHSAEQAYTAEFQQFEDLVSKRIFSLRGYDDDRIIASMHEYVGENHDSEILQEMQAATAALHNMVVPPAVVEFDFSASQISTQTEVVVCARTAALLLHRVLSALVPVLYGEADVECEEGEYSFKGASLYCQDNASLTSCGTRIPASVFSPACEFSKPPFSTTSLRSLTAVQALLGALSVDVQHLTSDSYVLELPQSNVEQHRADSSVVQYSLQQYHCLLDLYGGSAEVQRVLQHHLRRGEEEGAAQPTTVWAARSGLLLGSINLSAHPTVCHISQLSTSVVAAKKASEAGGESAADPSLAERALELAGLCVARRAEAKEAAAAGDFGKAVELLSEGLLDLLEGEEGEQEHGVPLPTHMKVALLTDRATYLREGGELEDALADTDRAIALQVQSAPAHSLRSQVRLELLQAQDQEAEGAGDGADKSEETVAALQGAAEDALLAFLLAGSSDMELAGSAEEAAREACRHSAKTIFQERRGATGDEQAPRLGQDNMPRSWLVGSYFGAYEPLSSALSVYAPGVEAAENDPQKVAPTSNFDVDSSDNLCDIDEGDHQRSSLPAVPTHLQDEAGGRPKDAEGYALLLALVEVLEAVTYDSAVNAESSNVSEGTVQGHFAANPAVDSAQESHSRQPAVQAVDELATVRHRDVVLTSTSSGAKKVVRSVAASLLAFAEGAGVEALAKSMGDLTVGPAKEPVSEESEDHPHDELELVASGTCTAEALSSESKGAVQAHVASAEAASSAGPIAEPARPCFHYAAVLSLLRGQGWPSGAEGLAPDLPATIREAVGALNQEAVAELTGVVFRSDGTVVSVSPSPLVDGAGQGRAAGKGQADSSDDSSSHSSRSADSQDEDEYGYGYGYRQEGRGNTGKAGKAGKAGNGGGRGFSAEEEFMRRAFGAFGMGMGEEHREEGSEEQGSGEESEWETVSGSEAGEHDEKNEEDGPGGARNGQEDAEKDFQDNEPDHVAVEVDTQAEQAQAITVEHGDQHAIKQNGSADPPSATSARAGDCADESAGPGPSRKEEVEAALREVEAQLQAHHQADDYCDNDEMPAGGTTAAPVVTEQATASQVPDPAPEQPLEALPVSHRLRARLLSVCASVAYLAGDATGAVLCLRAAVVQDPQLVDSQVKLGSLLVDMDEMKEAGKLLKAASKRAPSDYIALLHLAEMQTHRTNFDEAVHLLRKARKLAEEDLRSFTSPGSGWGGQREDAGAAAAKVGAARSTTLSCSSPTAVAEYGRRAQRACEESLANIVALLGINLFRQLPTRPEVTLHLLQDALASQFADNRCPVVLLCAGEVYSQAGDMVTALECFRKAQRCAPNNPLSYINAARTYQQLNQIATAERHLQAALLLDPAMAMVRVDLAQNLLLSGHAAQALQLLDEAVQLAKQVSEIRDVLTARTIAAMQLSLEERGLYCSSGARDISH